MYLSSGIVWWNTVSNTATFGLPGIASIAALIPVTAALLCTGASSAHSSIFAITSSSIRTDELNLSSPCATLCPIPSISSKLCIVLYFLSNSNCTLYEEINTNIKKAEDLKKYHDKGSSTQKGRTYKNVKYSNN